MNAAAPRGWGSVARGAVTAPSVVLLLALLAGQAGVLVLTPILVEVARDLEVSTAAAGQLRTVTGLVAGAAALALGRVASGVALRDLLLAGAALLALGSLGSAAAPSFALLAAAQVPVGLGVAVLTAVGAAAAGEWAAPERRARVLGWALMGPAVAWVVGMPLVGVAAERSWRLSFLVLPVSACVVVGFALSLCGKEQLPAARPLVRLGDLARDRVVAAWGLAELLVSSAWAGTLVFAGALFVESYGTSLPVTGVILGGVAVAYLPGNWLAARLAGRIRALTLLRLLTPVGAAGVLLLGVARPSAAASGVVLAGLGLVMGARTFAGSAFVLEAAADRRLAVMGIRAAALQFGYLVGAAAGGLALVLGGYPALGTVFAALLAAAVAIYFLLLDTEGVR